MKHKFYQEKHKLVSTKLFRERDSYVMDMHMNHVVIKKTS